MNGTHHYTAKDIEHYHAGELSAAERHALEKAALDDPFLADALEGYLFANAPAVELDTLQQKLAARIKNSGRHRGFLAGGWMRIAALFVLIAGGGWLVFRLLTPADELNTLARKQELAPTQSVPTPADSASVISDAPSGGAPFASSPETRPEQNVADNTSATEKKNAANEKDFTFRGAPRATGSPAANSPQASAITTDTSFNQLLTAGAGAQAESKEIAREVATTLQAASARKDTIHLGNIALKTDNTGLSEVVIASPERKANGVRRRQAVVVDSLEPAEGWTQFDDYVANNLKHPEDYKTKALRGEVELSFDVNTDGEPVNIVVTKPLCESCDAEAIRLLKEGPKWKKNNKKGKIKIKFPQRP